MLQQKSTSQLPSWRIGKWMLGQQMSFECLYVVFKTWDMSRALKLSLVYVFWSNLALQYASSKGFRFVQAGHARINKDTVILKSWLICRESSALLTHNLHVILPRHVITILSRELWTTDYRSADYLITRYASDIYRANQQGLPDYPLTTVNGMKFWSIRYLHSEKKQCSTI